MTPEELLKKVGEPVAWLESDLIHAYTPHQTGFFPNYRDKKGHGLFTSDQVAAAIIKATKPLEEEMSELKIYKAAYRMAAREMTGSDEPVELALEISQLRAQLAAAQKEVERLKTVPMKYRRMAFNAQLQDENNELRDQLAAAQAYAEQLRVALQTFIDEHEECTDADDWMAMLCSIEAHHVAEEALALPCDTSALDAYVAEKAQVIIESARELCTDQQKQIATLTRQRDLAVEALEKTRGALAYVKANGRDNPNLMESTAWHGLAAADKALATIKESENNKAS